MLRSCKHSLEGFLGARQVAFVRVNLNDQLPDCALDALGI